MTATKSEAALLAAVRANPGEDAPRLVLADWLAGAGRELEAIMQRIIAQPGEDRWRLAYADELERTAEAVQRCSGTHHHDGENFPLISGGFAWDAHGVIHRANPKQPHHHCDEKCRVSDGRAELAEFIRVQVELAQSSDCQTCNGRRWYSIDDAHSDDCYYCSLKLRTRERELAVEIDSAFGELPLLWTTDQIPLAQGIIVRRGLPAVVRCTLAEWMGGECERCGGTRLVYHPPPRGASFDAMGSVEGCPACHGTGRTPRIGPKLAQRWPIERVEIDLKREPLTILPSELIERMPKGILSQEQYPSALSDALLMWARQ